MLQRVLELHRVLAQNKRKNKGSNSTVKVLKGLKVLKILPGDNFKQAASKFNKEDKKRFEDAVVVAVALLA